MKENEKQEIQRKELKNASGGGPMSVASGFVCAKCDFIAPLQEIEHKV